MLFILLAGLLYGFLFQILHSKSSMLIPLIGLPLAFTIDLKLLFENGILANSFIPAVHLVSIFLVTVAYKYFVEEKKPASVKRRACCYENKSGGVLLSHAVAHVVSSALQGLTTEFGMGSGVAPALWPPETV